MSGVPRLKHFVTGIKQGWSPQCYPWSADGVEVWGVLKAGATNGGVFRAGENKELPVGEEPRPDTVVADGDLVISRANTRELVGSAAVVRGDFPRLMLSDKQYALRLDAGSAVPEFVALILGTRPWRDLIELEATGSSPSMQNISQADILNLPMPMPSLVEQRKILNNLRARTDQIDALIRKQEQLIARLSERLKVSLQEAFNAAPSRKHRQVRHLLSARPNYGVLVPNYVDETEGVPFVRVGDLSRLESRTVLPSIDRSQSVEFSRTRLRGGEVLLGVVGRMGQVALAPDWLQGANVARAIAVLRCRNAIDAHLLAVWFRTDHFLDQAAAATSGDSVQPTLGMADLARFSINWPADAASTLRHLHGQIRALEALKSKAGQLIALSKERRSALITAAVVSPIDVRDSS